MYLKIRRNMDSILNTPPFLLTRKSHVWFAVSGLGIIGAAYQLANIVMLLNFPGGIWCTGLVAVATFAAMAVIGVFNVRRSLRWFVWLYVSLLTALGILLAVEGTFFIGPVCFATPTMGDVFIEMLTGP